MTSDSNLDRISISRDDWENHFLANLIAQTRRVSALAYTICKALSEDGANENSFTNRYSFPFGNANDATNKYKNCTFSLGEKNQGEQEDWAFLEKQFPPRAVKVDFSKFFIDPAHKNLMTLAEVLQMPSSQRQLLTYIYLQQTGLLPAYFAKIIEALPQTLWPDFFARLFNDNEHLQEYKEALRHTSPLLNFGFLERGKELRISQRLLFLLGDDIVPADEIVSKIIGKPGHTDLTIADFTQFGDAIPLIVKTLKIAREKRQRGINILLFGIAGSGKTILAKTLIEEAGSKSFSVAESDDFRKASAELGDDSDGIMSEDSTRRMGELIRVQALLEGSDAMVIFDEAEDVLSGDNPKPKNKVMLNRLVEDNAVPTIWCLNEQDIFHSSWRQRFTLSLNVGFQPTKTRHGIWRTQAKLQAAKLEEEVLLQLARRYNVPPRIIEKAVAAFCRTGDVNDIRITIEQAARLTYGNTATALTEFEVPARFDPAYLNLVNGRDQVALAIAAAKSRQPMALRMQSAGDMGETELAHYIGEEGSLHVAQIFSQELLLGENIPYRNIGSKFKAAADGRLLLVIRELEEFQNPDPVSKDRWNHTLVGGLCEAIKRHPLPFVLVTKPDVELPHCLQKLFAPSIGLEPLTGAGAEKMCQALLGQENIKPVDGLTVGDLHAVKHRCGMGADIAGLLAELVKARQEVPAANGIGFGAIRVAHIKNNGR